MAADDDDQLNKACSAFAAASLLWLLLLLLPIPQLLAMPCLALRQVAAESSRPTGQKRGASANLSATHRSFADE
jgi:hypothetical protein